MGCARGCSRSRDLGLISRSSATSSAMFRLIHAGIEQSSAYPRKRAPADQPHGRAIWWPKPSGASRLRPRQLPPLPCARSIIPWWRSRLRWTRPLQTLRELLAPQHVQTLQGDAHDPEGGACGQRALRGFVRLSRIACRRNGKALQRPMAARRGGLWRSATISPA